MDIKVFRMLMKGIVTGAITGAVLLGPGAKDGVPSAPTQSMYNGCYPIGYWCGKRVQTDSFTVDAPSPLSFEECKTLWA